MAALRFMFVVTFCCLATIILHETHALHGLCAHHWLLGKCYDLNEECEKEGGECGMPGLGDHNEACACVAPNGTILRKNHLKHQQNKPHKQRQQNKSRKQNKSRQQNKQHQPKKPRN